MPAPPPVNTIASTSANTGSDAGAEVGAELDLFATGATGATGAGTEAGADDGRGREPIARTPPAAAIAVANSDSAANGAHL
jgi:hypothetical protein